MRSNGAVFPADDLPTLPESWRWTRLGDLVDQARGICYGIVQPGKHDASGVPMINSQDISDGAVASRIEFRVAKDLHARFKRSTIRGGEILLTLVGANFGRVAIAPDSWAGFNCSRAVGIIPVREHPEFVMFCLRSPLTRKFLDNWANTTAQPTFNLKEVANLPIPLPSVAEQKAIAAVLGALDDKIELNRRMNATLEEMARALFQSWFVDFDPVRAKLDRRQPNGLDPANAALFPNEFQDSDFGPIPNGWELCAVAEKIEILSGGTPQTSRPEYWDGDIPWYSVKDAPVDSDVWVIDTEKKVTQLGIDNSAAEVLPEGTTIFSARGTVGKLALTGRPMAMNQSCYGVRGKAGYADFFTYFLLREVTGQLQQHTHGTVFDTITRQTFESVDFPFPPSQLTAAFDSAVTPLLEETRLNLRESNALVATRDTLLPKLLSGEITVSKK
jgi:type I restriction enzyme S subunit